jgi:phosphoribosylanthranilate isomerase
MKRTRVKICGITNSRDAGCAVRNGADALGFNMYDKSARYLDIEDACRLVDQLPPYVTSVGLMVNHSAEQVEAILRRASFDLLQFHGDEANEFCKQFGVPFIKVLRVKNVDEIKARVDEFKDSKGILLDTFVEGEYGGTGVTFDWRSLPQLGLEVVLAGGLNAGNVGEAIREASPFAVDVSGGVESRKGQKDESKIVSFIQAVKSADNEVYS